MNQLYHHKYRIAGDEFISTNSARDCNIHVNDLKLFNNDLSSLDAVASLFAIQRENGSVFIKRPIAGNNVLTLKIESYDTVWAVIEIFKSNDYDFFGKGNFIFIDVGMNVGVASLFFAKESNITRVYGFEPIKETFEEAQVNFKLNPWLEDKISVSNFGLAGENKTIRIPSVLSGSLDVSIYDSLLKGSSGEADDTLEIELRKASDILKEIADRHSEKIILKLDCEGAEYEIMDDLVESNTLSKVDIIIMEWHYKGKENLIKDLVNHNFVVFAPDKTMNVVMGMIYAVKV